MYVMKLDKYLEYLRQNRKDEFDEPQTREVKCNGNCYNEYLEFAKNAVYESGTLALRLFRNVNPRKKTDDSYVTQADFEIQSFLEARIAKCFPMHRIIGEEKTRHVIREIDSIWSWVIDPIDGTGCFVSGMPTWGISLALLRDGKPVVGVFYLPYLNELYHAIADGPAKHTTHCQTKDERTKRLSVSKSTSLSKKSVFLVSSKLHHHFTSSFPGKQRCLGSYAAHQCIVAKGGADAAIMNPNIWDVAASCLILRQAGGEFVDMETGQPLNLKPYLKRQRLPWSLAVSSIDLVGQLSGLLSAVRSPDKLGENISRESKFDEFTGLGR